MRIRDLSTIINEAGHLGAMQGSSAPLAPVEMKQKALAMQKAQRNPNAQVTVPSTTGVPEKSQVVDLEGVIEDPDDPNNMMLAVAGKTDGELDIFNLGDAELLEHITRLAGVTHEDGKDC